MIGICFVYEDEDEEAENNADLYIVFKLEYIEFAYSHI